jgi:hypothetical protein
MYVYICMYIYVYIYICIYIYIYIYHILYNIIHNHLQCIYVCLSVCLSVCLCTCVSIHTFTPGKQDGPCGRVRWVCVSVCLCVYCVIHIPLCACSCTVSYTFLADKMGLVEECLCLSVCLSVCLCTYIYTHITGKHDGPCGRVCWEKWHSAWTRLNQPFSFFFGTWQTRWALWKSSLREVRQRVNSAKSSLSKAIRKCVSYASQANSPSIPCRFLRELIYIYLNIYIYFILIVSSIAS